MSRTTILALSPGSDKDGAVQDLRTLHNSWGSAPVIWRAFCVKYIRCAESGFMHGDTIKEISALWQDETIPEHHRALLMMTFDRAYVSKTNYEMAASDIQKWLIDFPPKDGQANHWPEIMRLFQDGPECEAIGIYHTSVSENPFTGPWDEEKEEEGPVDWAGSFELYSEIDGLKKDEA